MDEKAPIEEENQEKSDSESSNEDIREQELNNLFSIRQTYKLKESSKGVRTPSQKKPEKTSLKKIKSRGDVLKSSISTVVFANRDFNLEPSQSKGTLQRYRKHRVTYEDTHPRTAKKVYESAFDSKKPLKQKRFPILF